VPRFARARAALRRAAAWHAGTPPVPPRTPPRLTASTPRHPPAPRPRPGDPPDPFTLLQAESAGNPDSAVMARYPPIAPGSFRDPSASNGRTSPVRCGQCRLLTTNPKSARLHRTRDGRCLDPAEPGPRGGVVLSPAYPSATGEIVWGWPKGRYDRQAIADMIEWLTGPEWPGPLSG
jgi:hypothetical protein